MNQSDYAGWSGVWGIIKFDVLNICQFEDVTSLRWTNSSFLRWTLEMCVVHELQYHSLFSFSLRSFSIDYMAFLSRLVALSFQDFIYGCKRPFKLMGNRLLLAPPTCWPIEYASSIFLNFLDTIYKVFRRIKSIISPCKSMLCV